MRWLSWIVVAVAALFGPTSTAAQTVNPSWIRPPKPTTDDFPQFALFLGVEGRVIVRCMARKSGPPDDCEVSSEHPEGLGFGAAALAVAGRGVIDPGMVEGKVVDRSFVTTINFEGPFYDLPPVVRREWPRVEPGRLAMARVVAGTMMAGNPIFEDPEWVDVDPDRRGQVLVWFEEARDQREEMTERMALVLARSYTTAELALFMAGILPDRPPAVGAEFPFTHAQIHPSEFVRERYCQQWDCGTGR